MYHATLVTTTTLPLPKSVNRQRRFLLTAFICFAFSATVQAVCREGCLNSDTFLGEDALSLNGGIYNTAIGRGALFSTNGFSQDNTATGEAALYRNTSGSSNTATGSGAL